MKTRNLLLCGNVAAALSILPQTTWAQVGAWTPTSLTNAPSARQDHTAVWTGSRMIVWGGAGPGMTATGALYDPVADNWTPTSTLNAPSGRCEHTAVWTGSRMVVWGGRDSSNYLNTGAAYDPVTDTWTPTSLANAPAVRSWHTAVWTGSKMIVWGGYQGSNYYNTGAVYDPASDTWTPMSTVNAPYARGKLGAVWTGSRMIVWGGAGVPSPPYAAAYDPTTDTWTPITTMNAPDSFRWGPTAIWTGSRMIVWGGDTNGVLHSGGGIYDPAGDSWTATPTANAPSARVWHRAVWTDSQMVVWGGGTWNGSDVVDTGAAYDPVTDIWTPTSTANAPSARYRHTAIWTGSRMIVWGGYQVGSLLNTGALYDPSSTAPGLPTVSIVSPSSASVAGIVTVRAHAVVASDATLASLVYYIDGTQTPGTANDHAYAWDVCPASTTNPATSCAVYHTIRVVATDSVGRVAETSKQVQALPLISGRVRIVDKASPANTWNLAGGVVDLGGLKMSVQPDGSFSSWKRFTGSKAESDLGDGSKNDVDFVYRDHITVDNRIGRVGCEPPNQFQERRSTSARDVPLAQGAPVVLNVDLGLPIVLLHGINSCWKSCWGDPNATAANQSGWGWANALLSQGHLVFTPNHTFKGISKEQEAGQIFSQ
jgi:hypothetical protein